MTEQTDDPTGDTYSGNRSTRLSVPEMNTERSARRIAARLREVGGVVETVLQPRSGTVAITYDPDSTSEAELKAVVENAGFAVRDDPRGGRRRSSGRRSRSSGRQRGHCGCDCRGGPR